MFCNSDLDEPSDEDCQIFNALSELAIAMNKRLFGLGPFHGYVYCSQASFFFVGCLKWFEPCSGGRTCRVFARDLQYKRSQDHGASSRGDSVRHPAPWPICASCVCLRRWGDMSHKGEQAFTSNCLVVSKVEWLGEKSLPALAIMVLGQSSRLHVE